MLFLGKLVVVVSTIFIGIEIVDLRREEDGKVNHVWAPITLAAIFAYLTASCFIGVYEVSSYFVNSAFFLHTSVILAERNCVVYKYDMIFYI